MSIDTLFEHVEYSISTQDPDINSKEYWNSRQDVIKFNPDNVYAKRTVLGLLADDNPQLLETQGIFSAHLATARFGVVKHAATLAEALLVKKESVPLLIKHSAAAGGLVKQTLTPQIHSLALSSSESRSLMLEKFASPLFRETIRASSIVQSLVRSLSIRTKHLAIIHASISAQSLITMSTAVKLPAVCKTAQGLMKSIPPSSAYTELHTSAKHATALISANRVPLVSELMPASERAQDLIRSRLAHWKLCTLSRAGSTYAQALLRRKLAYTEIVGVRSACSDAQGLLKGKEQCAVRDFPQLFVACRLAQGLHRTKEARRMFRANTEASEVFQGQVKAGTACVRFLLNVITAEWAEGMVRALRAKREHARFVAATKAMQNLFLTVVEERVVYRRGVGLIVYTQNVLLDRKNERLQAAERERLVESKLRAAANRSETLNSTIEDYGVDLSSRSTLPKRRPKWVPDSEASTCYLCGKAFSFGNRRHHCRNCGKLVCAACTLFMALPHLEYYKPVRVCKSCKVILLANK